MEKLRLLICSSALTLLVGAPIVASAATYRVGPKSNGSQALPATIPSVNVIKAVVSSPVARTPDVIDMSSQEAHNASLARAYSTFNPHAGPAPQPDLGPVIEEVVTVSIARDKAPVANAPQTPVQNNETAALHQNMYDAADANPALVNPESLSYELAKLLDAKAEHDDQETADLLNQEFKPPVSAQSTPVSTALGYTLPEGGPLDDGRTLTLEEVISLSIKNSPERQVADAQIDQAGFAVEEARSNYYPQATIKAEAGLEYNDPFAVRQGATQFGADSKANSTTGNLRQMLYDGFITRQNVRQRLQLVESSELSKAKVTEELVKTSVEVYMNLYQFQQNEVAARENLDALEHIAQLVDMQIEAGDASEAERKFVAARVAAARQNHLNAQAGLRDSFAALTYLTGDIGRIKTIKPNLDAYNLQSPDEIIFQSLKNNIDVQLISSDRDAAKHELKANKGQYKPEIAIVLDGNHAEDVGGQTGIRDFGSAKVQLSYKLLDGGLRDATIGKSSAKIRELEAQIKRTRREVRQKVTSDINQYQTSIRELEITEQEITANVELEELYQQQFRQGDIDITNLVESRERIFAAITKKYRLQGDIVNSTFALLRNMAQLLPKFCGTLKGC